jgi:hypothetical protein
MPKLQLILYLWVFTDPFDMKIYPLESIVSIARSLSPYYKELYADLPETGWKLSDLPLVDQKKFCFFQEFLHQVKALRNKVRYIRLR